MPSRSAADRTVRRAISIRPELTRSVSQRYLPAGVRLHHQPHRALLTEMKGFHRARREVNREEDAGVDTRHDGRALAHRERQRALQNVSGAQPSRLLIGEKDVAGANGDADWCAELRISERYFQIGVCSIETALHHAGFWLLRSDGRRE